MEYIRVLSIRQPFASLIVSGRKRIENRRWSTNYRGPVLIHAGLKHDAMADDPKKTFQKGGIVGIADLVDVVTESRDPWFSGPYGFVFKNARPLKFIPCKGQLRLYSPDAKLLRKVFR